MSNEEQAQQLEKWVAQSGLSYSERFEAAADAFYRATGFIAPGKSVPLEMASTQHDERRREAWTAWCADRDAKFIGSVMAGALALRAQAR